MQLGRHAYLEVSGQPNLGTRVMQVEQPEPEAPVATGASITDASGDGVRWSASAHELIVENTLLAIVDEIRWLRQDLESRTLGARLARLWSTIREWLAGWRRRA